jgi:hypothetical protein
MRFSISSLSDSNKHKKKETTLKDEKKMKIERQKTLGKHEEKSFNRVVSNRGRID